MISELSGGEFRSGSSLILHMRDDISEQSNRQNRNHRRIHNDRQWSLERSPGRWTAEPDRQNGLRFEQSHSSVRNWTWGSASAGDGLKSLERLALDSSPVKLPEMLPGNPEGQAVEW